MTQGKTSILIACFNAERYVREAIESALAQTYQNVEVVVVDDGSTDGSVDVIRSFGPRIIWEAGPNRGACAARNRALALSSGEFINFLDADDLLLPEKVEKQLHLLASDEADIVFSQVHIFDDQTQRAQEDLHPTPRGDPLRYLFIYPFQTAAALHKRAWLERVGGFREHLSRGQEYDLHLRLAAAGARIIVQPDRLVRCRDHSGPRISRRRPDADHNLNIFLNLLHEIEHWGKLTDERRRLLAEMIASASVQAFRGGAKESAAQGFAKASELAGRNYHPDRRFAVRQICRWLGPLGTEKLLAMARRIWHRVRGEGIE